MLIAEVFKDKGPISWDHKGLAKHLVEKAKSYSLSSRAVYVTNDKLLKKTEKMQLANRSNTGMFAQMLLLVRRQAKHRGLQLIGPGSPEWFNLKEACKLATEFCNEFEMGLKEGYKEYLTTGMGMMKNFSIFKFKTIHAAICNRVEAVQEIKRDRSPDDTKQAHDYYLAIISERVGLVQDYTASPEKYQFFIKAKDEAHLLGISVKQYMQAQFGAFEWKSGIPDPMQLVGTKARERVQRWAFEKGIKLGRQGSKAINFHKIKKHGKGTDTNQ